VTPLGVAMGSRIGSIFEEPLVECMISAVATGTFLYIGMTEVVSEELEHGPTKQKIVAMISGALLMCAVNFINSWLDIDHHGHGHGHGHDHGQIHHA
jgi:zinc transporter ZupT